MTNIDNNVFEPGIYINIYIYMSHSFQLEYCNITVKPLLRRPSQLEFDAPVYSYCT